MENENYTACWYCDNIVSHHGQIGLLYLDFPRCFVLIPNDADLVFASFEDFTSSITEINWLDPHDKGTPSEQMEVLRILWNFTIRQEEKEEELYDLNNEYDEDW